MVFLEQDCLGAGELCDVELSTEAGIFILPDFLGSIDDGTHHS
jgi:hypothetical protein